MKCFQLVRSVLDEIYSEIPLQDEAQKDKAIKDEILSLRSKYAKLLSSSRVIDYENPITRFSYIYSYVTSHANIVYNIIESSDMLCALMDSKKVSMTSIGGGPGSDLLGVIKYLTNASKSPTLRCNLYDRESAWGESWSDVDNKLENPFKISIYFQQFDVGEPSTWVRHVKYLSSDLFTMVYFMSEVFGNKTTAEPFFNNLFANAKKGALFLYADNNTPDFYNWFDELAHRNSLITIESTSKNFNVNYDEEKTDLGIYYDKFGFPKLTANIAYRICQKQ
ncbi:MAG: hypothetical protein HY869_21000 [Chloroflexi bacterium]|nr:hypothetical protein [Chloroflexota bacterium]